MKRFFRRKYFVIIAAVLLVAAVFIFRGGKPPERDFVLVKKADVLQEVSITGKVEPVRRLDLAFEKAGKVARVYADVGDPVSAGAVIVEEDSSELRAQFAKARADLEAQKATLEKDRVVLGNYYESVADAVNDAYTKASDAVRKQIDEFFSDDERSPQLTFATKSSQLESDTEFARLRVTIGLNEWFFRLGSLGSSSEEELEGALLDSRGWLVVVRELLDLASRAVTDSVGLSQATVTSYQGNLNTARANINAALSGINSADQDIKSQKVAVAAQEASVESYAASVKNVESQLAKTVLVSPISGVVAKQDAKVGEIAAANQAIVSIISAGKLEVAANVPEADIAKLKIGDIARITLDAYGDDAVFEAVVSAIEPAETLVEGVATYKTTFIFTKEDGRPKSGMTANVDVLAASRPAVLVVPQRAISSKNGEKFVFVDTGAREPEERRVEVGLKGSDGNAEIISGLKEGEKVLLSL